MLRKPENKEWSRGVINRFNAAVFGTAERNTPQQQLPEDVPAEVQPSWEDDIMAKLGDFHVGGSQHANFDSEPGILSTPNQSGPGVLTTHGPVAGVAVDTAFSSQFTNVPSISGTHGLYSESGDRDAQASVSAAQAGARASSTTAVSQIQSVTITSELSRLSLNSHSSLELEIDSPVVPPVIIPVLVSVPSTKASSTKPKKGKAARDQVDATGDQAQAGVGRATRSRVKRV